MTGEVTDRYTDAARDDPLRLFAGDRRAVAVSYNMSIRKEAACPKPL